MATRKLATQKPTRRSSRGKPQHPLAEIFGFPYDNQSDDAIRHRQNQLCPFNNKVANCTKDKANNPLGTCSILTDSGTAITCPIRFRQDWIIVEDAARFFFPAGARWTTLNEVQLNDKHGKSAGNIDVVLVSYDQQGKVNDFGALEIQAVYISGNIRKPFEHYMQNPKQNKKMNWRTEKNYPNPDYTSSSRKRLAPQLLYKGGIMKAWGKRSAVALDSGFFNTLPSLEKVSPKNADIVWMVYDLRREHDKYSLKRSKLIYTRFDSALASITKSEPGDIQNFISALQDKLDKKLNGNPPDAPILNQPGDLS